MLSWDETYIKAKEILLGRSKLEKEFQLLKYFLEKKFSVDLINADIYYEPVFKRMSPSLRLIIDFVTDKDKLPIKHQEQKRIIGDSFINLLKENRINKYQELNIGQLRVQYIDIGYLKFEETSRNINSEILNFDSDIDKLFINMNTYFVFYKNTTILNQKKKLLQDREILARMIEVIKERGYNGVYLEQIKVILDEIASVEKVGGFYNYIR